MDDSIIREYQELYGKRNEHIFQLALRKLRVIYAGGDAREVPIRHKDLSAHYSTLLEEYLDTCRENSFSVVHIGNIGCQLRKFFRFLQSQGIASVTNVTIRSLLDFHNSDIGSTRNIRMMAESHVKGILRYLSEKGEVHESLWMFLEFLQDGLVYLVEDLDEEKRSQYYANDDSTSLFSREAYREAIQKLLKYLDTLGYNNKSMTMNHRGLMSFYTFLCVNDLHYRPEIVQLWLSQCSSGSKKSMLTFRRILLQAGDWLNGSFDVNKSFQHEPPEWMRLPDWCKKEILNYLDIRKKERMSAKTISMDMCSTARFCAYLVAQNLSSFGDLTAQAIKDFNALDRHKSVAGKNAYNSRIRGFLRFLGRKEVLDNPNLYLALTNKNVQKEKIIEILSQEDKKAIEDFCKTASTPMELRDKAILRLGMMMGVRGCDIAQMKISDIDWKRHTISFFQEKTDVEVKLHMPTQVGNAIYEYLKKGRPTNAKYPNVFLHHRAPFDPIHAQDCGLAIGRVLNSHGHRFHTTRRTFATEMFRAGNSKAAIIDATGQTNTESLRPYISLDCKKMWECPLSQADLGITAPRMDL